MVDFKINLDEFSIINTELGWILKSRSAEVRKTCRIFLPNEEDVFEVSRKKNSNFATVRCDISLYRKYRLWRFDNQINRPTS